MRCFFYALKDIIPPPKSVLHTLSITQTPNDYEKIDIICSNIGSGCNADGMPPGRLQGSAVSEL